MKIYYHNGKVVDKSPIISITTMKSGKIKMFVDKSINSILIRSNG